MPEHRSGPEKGFPLILGAALLAALLPAALALIALIAPAAASAAPGDEARIAPREVPATTPPVPGPPLAPPSGVAGLAEPPAPDAPAGKTRPMSGGGYNYTIPVTWAYPVGLSYPLWIRFDRASAHDMHDGIPAPPAFHKVILRDGVILQAKDQPRLAGGQVRFSDPHGTLMSVRASEVDLPATAAANHLDWKTAGVPAAAPAPAAAPRPDGPPH
jgi:hypothetical protein